MYDFFFIFLLIFGILQIILFFKIWGMTNNIKELLLIYKAKENRELGLPRKAILKGIKKEVKAKSVKSGKILCTVNQGAFEHDETYDFNEIIFQ